MTAARIVVTVKDQGTKQWEDTAILIDTYGNAAAQHEFNRNTSELAIQRAVNPQTNTAFSDVTFEMFDLITNMRGVAA